MRGGLKRIRTAVGSRGPLVVSLAALAFLLLIFGQIADEVMEGSTEAFDNWIVHGLRNADNPANPLGPVWLNSAARDVTALGSVIVLATLLLTIVGYLYLVGRRVSAWLMLAAVVGGTVLNSLLKIGFGRARPELFAGSERLLTASFPSGHAALSAITYLTLAALLTRTTTSRRLRAYYVAIGMLLTLAVGISRVYLGVHYPTDVLAGWCIGVIWALFCWTIFLLLQEQGEAEPPGRQSA